MCVNKLSLFLNSAFLLLTILSDSTGSIKDKTGAWIRIDVRKIGHALKANSKQMGRAAGGWKQLSRSLGAHYLFFVPSCLVGLQLPVFRLQPDSPYLILISLLSVLLTALFSHSCLRPEPSLLKSGHLCDGNLRAFCPHLSSLPLSWRLADAQQRQHSGLYLFCACHGSPSRQAAYNASELSFLQCEPWWSGAPFNDPCWI